MFRTRFSTKWVVMNSILSWALTPCLSLAACAPAAYNDKPRAEDSPQNKVANLATEVENGRVRSMDIVVIPADIMRNSAVSPQELQSQYSYKVSIPRLDSSRLTKSLISALRKTKVARTNRKTDLRWGVLFTFDKGQVQAIYLDGFGQFGEIDGMPVSFGEGGLSEWLKTFSLCLK
jgi:hypothetical protein